MNEAAPLPDPETVALPDNVADLQAVVRELLRTVREQQQQLRQARAEIEQLKRRLYGPRAERLDPDQLLLFAAEPAAEPPPPTPEPTPAASAPRRRGHGRRPLPNTLPRERFVHELPEAERACPGCGEPRQRIREEVSEQLDFRPASLVVAVHVRGVYCCAACEKQRLTAASATASDPAVPASTFATAPLPVWVLPRLLAGPGLLAEVIVGKYGDHLPWYRLERILARQGITLSRSTLWDWSAAAAQLLQPLYERMKQQVLLSLVVQTDDTPVPLKDGRAASATGYLWAYLGDWRHRYTIYDYTAGHSREGPRAFLGDYRGYLQADAYKGYDVLFRTRPIVEVGCWAHARRKFYEARQSAPEEAHQVLGRIRQLYAVEREARQWRQEQSSSGRAVSEEEFHAYRYELRRAKAEPLLTELEQWLRAAGPKALPKSPPGEAIGYALNQWEALRRYLEARWLEIDNNASERALRTVALGRKNWIFHVSERGGRTSAVLFSFTQTCARQGLDPVAYLRDVLSRIRAHPADRLDELLPDRWAESRSPAGLDPPGERSAETG